MREQRIQLHRQTDRRDRARPTAAHRVGHGHAHRRGLAHPLLFQMRDEFLEVLHGDAARRAAAGDAREVGGVQTEFVHARLEPGRKIARALGVGRHGQTAHGGLHPAAADIDFRLGNAFGLGAFRRHMNVQAQPRGLFLGGLDLPEHRADGVAFIELHGEFLHAPAAGRRHGHRGLVGLDFDEVLVGQDGVAGLDEKIDDGGLGDRFAELRHDDGNLHKI